MFEKNEKVCRLQKGDYITYENAFIFHHPNIIFSKRGLCVVRRLNRYTLTALLLLLACLPLFLWPPHLALYNLQ
jgi:hypothetical protein